MARALFLKAERMNALLVDFFDRCNGGGYERNPVTAPYCLVILMTGAGQEAPQVTGGDLTKYGCARLQNAIGYACDFEFTTGLRGGLYDIPEFAPFRSIVGRTRGRFFETREGWLHEPLE